MTPSPWTPEQAPALTGSLQMILNYVATLRVLHSDELEWFRHNEKAQTSLNLPSMTQPAN
jgi:hypothetical protein